MAESYENQQLVQELKEIWKQTPPVDVQYAELDKVLSVIASMGVGYVHEALKVQFHL